MTFPCRMTRYPLSPRLAVYTFFSSRDSETKQAVQLPVKKMNDDGVIETQEIVMCHVYHYIFPPLTKVNEYFSLHIHM